MNLILKHSPTGNLVSLHSLSAKATNLKKKQDYVKTLYLMSHLAGEQSCNLRR